MPDTSKIAKEVLSQRRADIYGTFTSAEDLEFNFMRFIECNHRHFLGGNQLMKIIHLQV